VTAIRRRLVGPAREEGISLVEVLIAMALSLVLLTIVVSAFFGGSRLQRATSAESDGLTDLRTTVERLGRDVRAARGIDTAATASTLSMWIDSNSDYIKQSTEVVTWSLTATSGGLYDVVRTTGGGASLRQSSLVVNAIAFSYRETDTGAALALPLSAANAAKVRIVTGTIQYDAKPGVGTTPRFTTFSERLRNVS
jgi:Tfp pilus assembly protein PilW